MLGDCVNWTKYKDRQGYGRIMKKGNYFRVHRYFYEQKFGKIAEGLVVDHLCRNPSCINPDHMEVVTNAENVRRGNSAKLNYSLVENIKNIYRNMNFTQLELAKNFGVTQSTISRIVNQRRWI